MTDILVVYVTAPAEIAPKIARELVEARLCACVNIVPAVRSIYRWQDAIHDDAESLMIIKTSRMAFSALRDAVVRLHPYQVPEVIALPVENAHLPYREWVLAESSGKGEHA